MGFRGDFDSEPQKKLLSIPVIYSMDGFGVSEGGQKLATKINDARMQGFFFVPFLKEVNIQSLLKFSFLIVAVQKYAVSFFYFVECTTSCGNDMEPRDGCVNNNVLGPRIRDASILPRGKMRKGIYWRRKSGVIKEGKCNEVRRCKA